MNRTLGTAQLIRALRDRAARHGGDYLLERAAERLEDLAKRLAELAELARMLGREE